MMMNMVVGMDGGETEKKEEKKKKKKTKLRILNRSLCYLDAALYFPPEALDVHPSGYAHSATVVRPSDDRSAQLPSLLLVTAMQPIRHDADIPPLASTVREPDIRARDRFQQYSDGDGIVQRWSFREAVDLAVGMGEEQEEIMEHLAQVLLSRHR